MRGSVKHEEVEAWIDVAYLPGRRPMSVSATAMAWHSRPPMPTTTNTTTRH